MMKAASNNRWGHRDATMLLVAYRHGLRASELVDLRWDQIDFSSANLHVRRVEQGAPATHPIQGDELRALRRLQREQDPVSPFVFTSERGSPFTTSGFAPWWNELDETAELGLKVHPHMLRHAWGFALANAGHDTRALRSSAPQYSAHGEIHRASADPLWTSSGNEAIRRSDRQAPRHGYGTSFRTFPRGSPPEPVTPGSAPRNAA